MRTGKDLILATKPYTSDHPAKSWWYILSTAALLIAFMAGTLFNHSLPGRIVCSVLSALLILRFFVIYHDQQHHAILPNSKLAEGLMRLFGIFILSPSSIWRSSHNHHHNHNSKLKGSHIGSYPIMTKEHFLKCSKAKRMKYLFMRHPLTILFGYAFMFLFGMSIYPFFNNPKAHYDCLIAFVLHVTLIVVVAAIGGWVAVVLTVLIPFGISCCIGSYLFYAQHNFPGVTFRDNAGWTYDAAALESSSFMKMGTLMNWFSANIGYHHIHHLNSKIPFYRLPEALSGMPELQKPKVTSLHPMDIIRCLRLKVWDVETQQMVPLPTK
ncbi:MAG TPA: fatty acid desaturase [Verrucomicrobiae bacterium]